MITEHLVSAMPHFDPRNRPRNSVCVWGGEALLAPLETKEQKGWVIGSGFQSW